MVMAIFVRTTSIAPMLTPPKELPPIWLHLEPPNPVIREGGKVGKEDGRNRSQAGRAPESNASVIGNCFDLQCLREN